VNIGAFAGVETGRVPVMKLNDRAVAHARSLIRDGKFVNDDRDGWSEHQPSAEEENEFLEKHGFAEYAKWYLGIDEDLGEETKGHYTFPYGDFKKVHRCGLLAAESRAGQRGYDDIERAAHELHSDLEAKAS
jgi:hypothetical protein